MRLSVVVSVMNDSIIINIFILTTTFEWITRIFFLNPKNVEIQKILKLLKNDLVVLNETD